MGFGPFSSSSKSSVKTTNEAINTGFSEIGGQATSVNVSFAGLTVGKKAKFTPVINLTDQGAISAALALSNQSLRGIELLGARLEGVLGRALEAVTGQGKEAIDAVGAANRGEVENLGLAALKWGALVGGGYLLARSLGAFK